MTPEQLKNWHSLVGLSQRKAAKIMGYSLRQWQEMVAGDAKIRPCVDLACAAYALGIRSYKGPDGGMHGNKST